MPHQPSKALAVDFGGTTIKIAVTCGETLVERAEPLPTPNFSSPEATIEAMVAVLRRLRERHPDVVGVGLGMPGWVDFYRGILYQLTNVPGWTQPLPLRAMMEEALGLPAVIDNDAKAMGYAEWKLGAGRGCHSLCAITLGTGLGGCLVLHDRIVRARSISCAELGQTSIDYRGKTGPFGNRGAIEEYIGNNELAAEAVERYAAAGICKTAAECTPYLLEQAARAGDAIAAQLYRDVAERLACLLLNIMYALVPEAFVIGGGVAKAGDLLFEPLRAALRAQLFAEHAALLRLLPARFGADAGLIGAGLMAADHVAGTLR